jgi:type I restriction enzyme, S subunit
MSFVVAWPVLTLKASGVSLIDCDHQTPTAAEEGYPYIAIPQLKSGHISLDGVRRISHDDYLKWTKKLKPQANDVIVVRRCNSGDSAHVPPGLECAIGQNLIVLRADGKTVLPEFLRWLINGPDWWDQVSKYINVGAVFDSLRCRDIPNFELTIPPVEHQREISTVLGALDDRITLLRETNTTLEAIAQALFKSWFVDFDPIRAKQEGREPEGMDADTAALFPDSFEESVLGVVPKGWRVGTLADLAKLNPESWTARTHPETVKYIDLANAKNNNIDVITEYVFDEAPSRARRVLRNGDCIIGTVRPGNRSFAYIYQAPSNLTGSTGFAVLRPKNAQNSEFLFVAATQDSSIDHLAHVADGGAYPAVRPEVVANIQSILPSEEALNAFHNIVAPLFSRVGENQAKAQTLTTLRDTLLPHLISGQLRLPDAEALIEEATL